MIFFHFSATNMFKKNKNLKTNHFASHSFWLHRYFFQDTDPKQNSPTPSCLLCQESMKHDFEEEMERPDRLETRPDVAIKIWTNWAVLSLISSKWWFTCRTWWCICLNNGALLLKFMIAIRYHGSPSTIAPTPAAKWVDSWSGGACNLRIEGPKGSTAQDSWIRPWTTQPMVTEPRFMLWGDLVQECFGYFWYCCLGISHRFWCNGQKLKATHAFWHSFASQRLSFHRIPTRLPSNQGARKSVN